MEKYMSSISLNLVSQVVGGIVFLIGFLNLFLVHPIPGGVFLIISLAYLPATNNYFKKRYGLVVPDGAKIFLGIVIIWFTLGVSDLGDILDDGAAELIENINTRG